MMSVTQRYRRSRLLPAALAAALFTGCVYSGWPFRKNGPGEVAMPDRPNPGTAGDPVDVGGQDGVGWKLVTGKREPFYLISRDGTECMVSKEKWEKTVIGTQVLCLWSKAGS